MNAGVKMLLTLVGLIAAAVVIAIGLFWPSGGPAGPSLVDPVLEAGAASPQVVEKQQVAMGEHRSRDDRAMRADETGAVRSADAGGAEDDEPRIYGPLKGIPAFDKDASLVNASGGAGKGDPPMAATSPEKGFSASPNADGASPSDMTERAASGGSLAGLVKGLRPGRPQTLEGDAAQDDSERLAAKAADEERVADVRLARRHSADSSPNPAARRSVDVAVESPSQAAGEFVMGESMDAVEEERVVPDVAAADAPSEDLVIDGESTTSDANQQPAVPLTLEHFTAVHLGILSDPTPFATGQGSSGEVSTNQPVMLLASWPVLPFGTLSLPSDWIDHDAPMEESSLALAAIKMVDSAAVASGGSAVEAAKTPDDSLVIANDARSVPRDSAARDQSPNAIDEASSELNSPQDGETGGGAASTPASGSRRSNPAGRAHETRSASAADHNAGPEPMTLYTIQEGDSLGSIAAEWFGRSSHWELILEANPGLEPRRMQIGQQIRLPGRDLPERLARAKRLADEKSASLSPQTQAGAVVDQARLPEGAVLHVVAAGETLSSIAKKHYGRTSLWRAVYEANQKLIGEDPNALEVGMSLVIPKRAEKADASGPRKMAKG